MSKNLLTDRYVILSFNGEETTGHGSEQNRKNHFLVAARFLELLTDGKLEEKNGEYALGKNMEAAESFGSIFKDKSGYYPLQSWMDAIAGLPGKVCADMRQKKLEALRCRNDGCDTLTAGIGLRLSYEWHQRKCIPERSQPLQK